MEASSRGLKTALIEKYDFASGSSSRSTKLIHGGIRYLEQAFKLERGFVQKIKLVSEALKERTYMLNSLYYLNKQLNIIVPCDNAFWLAYYGVGVHFYHFISFIHWLFHGSYAQVHLDRPHFISKT